MQLVLYGAQDIYLTGNPEMTWFKATYRRHTNFAIESVEQQFNTRADFGATLTVVLDRTGDLLAGACLQTTLPNLSVDGINRYVRWTDDIGHHLIEWVNIEISGQVIDRHCSDWLEVWAQLTVPAGQEHGYREMIGQDPRGPLNFNSGLQMDRASGVDIPGRTIFVPLQFWFCRHIGASLPLIALQHSEVRINLKLRRYHDLVAAFNLNDITTPLSPFPKVDSLSQTALWLDYVYLDTDERRRFAQINHEYLIEQLQTIENVVTGSFDSNKQTEVSLDFDHPVKELIWIVRSDAATSNGHVQWSNYTDRSAINFPHAESKTAIFSLSNLGALNMDQSTAMSSAASNFRALTNPSYCRPPDAQNNVVSAYLTINGRQRFSTQDGFYFNWYQCLNHHSNIPKSPGINVYSFALNPEKYQPSGATNFSRIHRAKLMLTLRAGTNHSKVLGNITADFSGKSGKIKVFARNTNILRVMSGMGGIAYRESQ
jgi:hypothetical protein